MTYFRVVLLLAFVATTASAQVLQQGMPQSNLLDSSALAREIANATKAAQQNAGANKAKSTAGGIIVNRSGPSTAAKKLAATYPSDARGEVELVFSMLLERYSQVEQRLGMPANELGGAVALFLVTSLQAYQGRDTQIEQFQTVAAQMRGILSAAPYIAQASNTDKQEVYEQLAILGMFLDGTYEALQKTPNPTIAANIKVAAKGYLEQFLGTDAERVELTAQGLVIKDAAVAAAAPAETNAPARTGARTDVPASASEKTETIPAAGGETIREAPAKTGARRRIEAVVLKQNWTMGIGGSMVLRYDPLVLFSDGAYTSDTDTALTPAAKLSGRWRKESAHYILSKANGKVEKIPFKLGTKPARAQQTLSGRYSSLSALGGGTTGTAMVAAWRDYTFAPDGTVRFDRGAGASTNDQTGAPDGTSVVTQSKASSTGRYSVDGYTITLTFEDGETEQRLFYFFPDSENTIGLGAGTYLKDKK